MKKEFLPYEQALALKELGFNKECLRIYVNKSLAVRPYDESNEVINAPLYQQAFSWFREKYNIESSIFTVEEKNKYSGSLKGNYTNNFKHFGFIDFYDTYEEAQLECLKKLIEILKEK
jgi:hypothetical protein